MINYEIGDRVPTVGSLSEELNISRGTIQSAFKLLNIN